MTVPDARLRSGAGRGDSMALGHGGRGAADAWPARIVLARTIGSEFLPHLDEGAIWARGTLAPSTGPTEGTRIMNEARVMFAKFPEVTQVVSQVGRPDDGTDYTGFFNTEYFIDLRPKEQWRPHVPPGQGAVDRGAGTARWRRFPGVVWNFSQPIADNMEEAVSGVKGELAVKIYGTDLKLLEAQGRRNRGRDEQDPRRAGSRHFPRHRPAEPEPDGEPRQGRALRNQRLRRSGRDRNRHRRQGRVARC